MEFVRRRILERYHRTVASAEATFKDGKATVGVSGDVAALIGLEVDASVTVDTKQIAQDATTVAHAAETVVNATPQVVNTVVHETTSVVNNAAKEADKAAKTAARKIGRVFH